jgi:hypothetical protein
MIRRVALRGVAFGAMIGLFGGDHPLSAQPQFVQLSIPRDIRVSSDGLRALRAVSDTDFECVDLFPPFSVRTVPGARQPVIGLSSDGQVVAAHISHDGSSGLAAGAVIAGRWTNGAWSAVPPIPGATVEFSTISYGTALSADGRFLLGWAFRGDRVGFIHDASVNVSTALVHPDNNGHSTARSVSADGRVVVGNAWASTTAGRGGAVVWERDGVTGQWSGRFVSTAPVSTASAVSADGSTIVGTAGSSAAGSPAPSGVAWRRSGDNWTPIEIPPPSSPSDPIWSQAGVWPTAVSGDGSIVIGQLYYQVPASWRSELTSFIWTAAHGTRTLGDFATDIGVASIPPNCLAGAHFISPDGRVMLGQIPSFSFPPSETCYGPWILRLDAAAPFPTHILRQPAAFQPFNGCGQLELRVEAIGVGPLSYQWRRNGVNLSDGRSVQGSFLSGSNEASLVIRERTAQDAGVYDVVISGPGGVVVSAPSEAALDTSVQPPPNATCPGALTIAEGTVTANPCATFVTDGEASCASQRNISSWYRYIPSFTGNARIDTCDSDTFTVTSVYASCSGPELACDRTILADWCGASYGNVVRFLPVQAGVPVYIRVGASYPGEVRLTIAQAPAQPVNDLCSAAMPAVIGYNDARVEHASWEGAESSCTHRGAWDVWYSFTAPELGTLTVYSELLGNPGNTTVTAYSSCSGQEVACSKDLLGEEWGLRGFISVLRHLPMSAGQSVLLRITGSPWIPNRFWVRFTPGSPCIADVSGCPGQPIPDGWVAGNDLADFVAAFVADDPLADVVGIGGLLPADGLVTGDDFNAFIAAFASGCP